MVGFKINLFDPLQTSMGCCFYCSASTSLQCQCGEFYCSDKHLKIHRPGQYCLPFRVRILMTFMMTMTMRMFQVRFSPEVGRYLVAARDIKPLELVLWDTAAVGKN